MTATTPVDAAFRHRGGDVGVLLCHGFTGSPASMRPWADDLVAQGYTVALPLLPGHGTRWQDLNRTTFDDWLGCLQSELAELSRTCRTVVVAGLSMGGTLALRLAQLHPEQVAGLMLVNPSVMSLRRELRFLPVLKYLRPAVDGIAEDICKPGAREKAYTQTPLRALDSLRRAWALVRADLPRITAPVLLMHSRIDHVVEPVNAEVIAANISSTDVTDVVLERSFHVATLDHDADLIHELSRAFLSRVTGVSV